MRFMNILQIAHDHPDWTPGGTEIVAHTLARALDRRDGVNARYLAASTSLHRPETPAGALEAVGGDLAIRTGSYDRFTMKRLDGVRWIESLSRAIDFARPDIVHLHGLDRLGAEMIPALRRLSPDCRIVLTLHDYQLICPNDGLLLSTVDRTRCDGAQPDRCRLCFPEQAAERHAQRRAYLLSLLGGVDVFLAPSEFLLNKFVDWGIDRRRISLVRNAVVCDRGNDEAKDLWPRKQRNRFSFFGNVSRHKGVMVLLAAAERLRSQSSDVGISIHGGLGASDEEFRREFETALRAAGTLVQHFGPYHRADVIGLMRKSDWIVVPSIWWENAPLVIHEARAAGRPVICSGIGGMSELVEHGKNGLHVPAGDAALLADTLHAAADPDLWDRLAKPPAPDSHPEFVDAHLRIYSDLIRRAAA